MIGRIAYAFLAGIIAFIIATVIGKVAHVDLLITYAALIGLLVGLVVFFGNRTTPTL